MSASVDYCCPPAWSRLSAHKDYPLSVVNRGPLPKFYEKRDTLCSRVRG